MRLTLRTLLAYLDGILDPADAQDLGKKIEESEFATSLVHRLRDVMRRLRLGAPSITDRGPGLDPNTVAEYLDNTLPTENVTDFEKVCLDSDVHLAEVASCHQVLTLVLGEPAEVSPTSRQRMYDVQNLQSGIKPPPTPDTSAAQAAAPSLSLDLEVGDDDSRKSHPKSTVPEYLRDSRRRPGWLPITAGTVLAICVVGAILYALGQFERGTKLGDMLVSSGVVAAPKELAEKGTEKRGEGKEDGKTAKEAAPVDTGTAGDAKQPPVKPDTEPVEQPLVASAPKATEPIAEPATAVPETAKNSPPIKPEPIASEIPPPKLATGTSTVPPAIGHDSVVKNVVPLPVAPEVKPGEEANNVVPKAAEPEPLGRLLSPEQVLLCSDPTSDWTRVGREQMLTQQHVLALPTYRAKVVLLAGVALEILGGTRVELLAGGPHDLPGIRIVYGRVVLMPSAKAGTRLRVAFGNHGGTLTFGDVKSTAALDVRRIHATGMNPETEPSRVAADLFAATGAVTWQESVDGKEGQPVSLSSPQWLGFDGPTTVAPVAAKEVPSWITVGEPIKPVDRRASPVIAQLLPTDGPARVGLLEVLAASRQQKEVRRLTMRSLGYIGQFRDVVAALNDATCKLEWDDYYIEWLRDAVARDPESAAAVRIALETQFPNEAADLYRMLWGYTNKQLESGDEAGRPEDAKLVQGLRNDDVLAVRVLSFWNLRNITGKRGNYQPELLVSRRQQGMRRWEDILKAKEIRFIPTEQKTGLPPRKPIAPATPPTADGEPSVPGNGL